MNTVEAGYWGVGYKGNSNVRDKRSGFGDGPMFCVCFFVGCSGFGCSGEFGYRG